MKHLLLLLVFSVVIAACGGGGGGGGGGSGSAGIISDDVNGIWREPTSDAIGIISDDGWDVDIVDRNYHYHGDLRSVSGVISSELAVHSNASGLLIGFIDGNGMLVPKVSIHADYNGTIARTLDMTYDPVSDRQPSLAIIGGIWSQTTGQYTVTITIDNTGSLFGSDTDGCTYSGSVTIPDPGVNIYRFDMLNDCYGSFADGQGVVIDTVTANDTLVYAVRGYFPTSIVRYSLTDTLYRQ